MLPLNKALISSYFVEDKILNPYLNSIRGTSKEMSHIDSIQADEQWRVMLNFLNFLFHSLTAFIVFLWFCVYQFFWQPPFTRSSCWIHNKLRKIDPSLETCYLLWNLQYLTMKFSAFVIIFIFYKIFSEIIQFKAENWKNWLLSFVATEFTVRFYS